MARRSTLRIGASHRVFRGLLSAAFALLVPAAATADLTGRWHFEWLFSSIEVITQTGSNVSFTLNSPYGSSMFSGTVTGNQLATQANDPSRPGCPIHFDATIAADELSMNGGIYTHLTCPPLSGYAVAVTRCECFDGNSSNGDGCSSECRIEPCYACSGDPSVCSPLPDGSACDDQMACTTGETCTSGLCSGGSPVPPPCIDMTGGWLMRFDFPEDPGFPIPPDAAYPLGFTQRNSELETASMRGSIDTATGHFALDDVSVDSCGSNRLTGTVAANGSSLTGTFVVPERISFSTCANFQASVIGTRCGGATLDPNEECDDGNDVDGDGCSAQCTVEPCYDCTGSPSACTPLPNTTSCDDGDACTLGDTCNAGVCSGSPLVCAPCHSCNGSGQCVAAPRTGCRRSTALVRTALTIRDDSNPAGDTLAWNWRKGEATNVMDLGDPTQTTTYTLCVYDESTAPPTALVAAPAPQVGCPDAGCWTSRASGFSYRNATGANSGLTRIDLRAKGDGRANVSVRGKDSFLDPPRAPLALPLRVQLQATDSTTDLQTCFEAEYAAPGVRVNDNGVFRARATGP